jgi:FkbM family methyltransferase
VLSDIFLSIRLKQRHGVVGNLMQADFGPSIAAIDGLPVRYNLAHVGASPAPPHTGTTSMSRKLAAIAGALVKMTTALTSSRQRSRTYARVIDDLSHSGAARLSCQRGTLLLNPYRSAHCASAAERFFSDEPETLAWIDGFANDAVFFDIGASIGVFSLYAALNKTTRVIAVEPNGLSFGTLVEHIALNAMDDRISPLCLALGAATTLEHLHLKQVVSGAGGSSLGASFAQQYDAAPGFSQAITCYTLDELVDKFGLPAPTYIKIDVDGLEPDILRGARRTLAGVESVMMEVEHRSDDDIEQGLVTPLRELGLIEDLKIRTMGSGRNRLYCRQR